MKRHWHHPEPPKTGRRYWRSLSEYSNTPEHQARVGREFDPGLSEMGDEERENTRRDFMKIMGGAAALSGLTLASCRRPLQNVVPFAKHVEWIIPGKPLLYATAMPRPWGATPLLVTCYEGRPTHLQGNSLHPYGAGMDVFAQASILELYNPDRAKAPKSRVAPGKEEAKDATWEAFQKEYDTWSKQWAGNGGDGLAVLMNSTTSPTIASLVDGLKGKFAKAKTYSYEPINRKGWDTAVKALLGDAVEVVPDFAKATRVFSLDCDFIGLDTLADASVRDFMKSRAPSKASDALNRVYVLENRYTLTGGIADHRKPLAASLIPQATALLAQEVGRLTNDAALQKAATALATGASTDLQAWVAPAAADLVEQKGKSLVLAGPRYDSVVQSLVLGINKALGAFGSVLNIYPSSRPKTGTLDDLLKDLGGKSLKQLFIFTESDPVYDTPGFKEALAASGAQVIYLGLRENATAKAAHWSLPAAHYLEAWGDARCSDGTYAVVQPMIAPLFGGASLVDLLLSLQGKKNIDPSHYENLYKAALAKDPKAQPTADPSYDAVKETFGKVAGGWSEDKWNTTLRDGFLANSVVKAGTASVDTGKLAALTAKAQPAKAPSKESLEVVLTPDATLWDGRYVDNSWLQEAPDPISKLTWDNAAWMSPRTFRDLCLKNFGEDNNEQIEITVAGKKLKIVALECPGHAHNSITISLGYGQESLSAVGNNVGVDAGVLRSSPDDFVLTGATVEATDEGFEMAITQDNYTMEGRTQIREATQSRFKEDEKFAQTEGMDAHIPPDMTFYQGRVGIKSAENPEGFDYEHQHQWGMAIDLGKCIGCSACIVACQSENNIPIVGKDQVRRGRVMHWIRMDRYFATTGGVEDHNGADVSLEELDNPEMVTQPVACQNCESAPCETVCPVNATVHTEDGLNAMAYNRCIGTRYCGNNCPYIARRFNWFDYNKRNPLITTKLPIVGEVRNLYAGPFGERKPQEVVQLQKNPNVTVRMRGVMEKCTYCVQRLEEAKIRQRRIAKDDAKNLRIPADAVQVACQASCPAEAIMFGDLANPKSTVNKWKENPRNYQVLKYIGTRPRTSYLARIRNVNPKMPDDRVLKTGEATMKNNA